MPLGCMGEDYCLAYLFKEDGVGQVPCSLPFSMVCAVEEEEQQGLMAISYHILDNILHLFVIIALLELICELTSQN